MIVTLHVATFGDLGARCTLRHRLPEQSIQGDNAANKGLSTRCRHHAEAVSEAAARDRRHLCVTVLQEYRGHGRARLSSLSANYLLPHWLPHHWKSYATGKAKAGLTADPADWRVARTIFVADDDKVAVDYARFNSRSPYRFYYSQLQTKLTRAKRHETFKLSMEQPDEEITHDWVMDRLVIHGSVNKVVDELLAFCEVAGPFGELVYGGMDWVDANMAQRSMELMATEVMPRVNAASGSKLRV
jgi:hypothetical protein